MCVIYRVIKFFISFVCWSTFICCALSAYLSSDDTKPVIAQTLSTNLTKLTGADISIGNVSYSFPYTFTFTDVIVQKEATLLTGNIEIAITISGAITSPWLHTTAKISNGTFENLNIGTALKDVSALIEGVGKEISLKELSATDGFDGTITGSGMLSIDSSKRFPFVLDCEIENAALLNQDFATGKLSGNLCFQGNSLGATLSGFGDAKEIVITIPEQIPALINSIDITYINQAEDEIIIPIQSPPSWPLAFDIHIKARDNIMIHGRDLTSEWKGQLTITGSAGSPSFLGNFKILQGHYLFNGKNFDINQGSILLEEHSDKSALPKKPSTTVYVIASKDLGKIKVEVILKGPLTHPEISFRSNPPLPQKEILSWILFNKGSSEISPFQGMQLTESITDLKNNHSGSDVLTKIRNALKIDRIDISRDENSETGVSVQVGKYISQNVFVSVNKSDVNQIAIEAALMPNITLQAHVDDNSKGKILLKWKHDY